MIIGDLLLATWRALPLSVPQRQRLQRFLFRNLPWAFGRTEAFQARTQFQLTDEDHTVASDLDQRPVPLQTHPLPRKPAVRLIAFYLPQFHPIPENDAWWGLGFTEWRNVVSAKPQFAGHYQPHLPGELGFYDLRLVEIQRRQVELAKLYGIGGFAIYFYWFGGKRLLEHPLRQYLENRDLDLPFCLCWANENWSKRWDGRESDILIAQAHSESDDQQFIRYVSEYFADSRYIRIAGRPLLIVYRPDLLPSAKETAARWRQWCRAAGIGEIFLAYTQSFEASDPDKHGFDAAIEFPPNSWNAPSARDRVRELVRDFSGLIRDWRAFPALSRDYVRPGYRLFRGVNTGWDNTARRSNAALIYVDSSPSAYREWLSNAVADTVERFSDPSERLVFVNAWNEWAEGAHLEPDQKYAYAYLQATRDALMATAEDERAAPG